MILIPEGYVDSSCVIKTKKNDLLTMGTLRKIRDSYIDISDSRNEFPEINYNKLVKIEIYNSRLGFRVLIGNIYISTKNLLRIINLNEATNQEHREYFRITVSDEAFIYSTDPKAVYVPAQSEDGHQQEALCVSLVDISLGGVLVKVAEEMPIGEEFCIKIPAIGADVLYRCIVRRKVGFGNDDIGMGCEFQDMSVLQEDLLYRFILKRQNAQLKRVR